MKYVILFFNLLIFSTLTQAQITEEERSMVQGLYNSLVLELPDTEEHFVEKLWKKYLKDYGARVKKVKGGSELFAANVDIVAVGGSGGVNLYSDAQQSGENVLQTVWFDLGDAGYLNSRDHENSYIEGEKFLMRFALYVTKEMIQIELDEQQKDLKNLQTEMTRLKRQNEGYRKDIELAKERIAKAEANIEQNIKDQEEAAQKIEAQEEVVKEVQARLGEL